MQVTTQNGEVGLEAVATYLPDTGSGSSLNFVEIVLDPEGVPLRADSL